MMGATMNDVAVNWSAWNNASLVSDDGADVQSLSGFEKSSMGMLQFYFLQVSFIYLLLLVVLLSFLLYFIARCPLQSSFAS